MKKLYTLLFIAVSGITFAQVTLPYYESFNYTVASNLGGQGSWTNLNTGDEIVVTSGNLSYTGLKASTGNSINFSGAGIDPQQTITSQSTGTVYSSFIFKVTDLSTLTLADGGYFFGFGQNGTSFASTIFLKTNGAGFQIGINKSTAIPDTQYLPTVYSLNTEYFIVVAYDLGTTKTSSIWINPVSTSLGAAIAPTPTLSTTTGTTDRTSIDRIFLRQDSTTETPTIAIDELRVGLSWADVTPAAPLAVNKNEIAGLNIYPNPVSKGTLYITSSSSAAKSVVLFDVLGKQVLKTSTSNNSINVSGLKNGVYIIKITEDGKTDTKKLIIQ